MSRYFYENPMSHPSERFEAPRSITRGIPLKTLMNETLIGLVGESFRDVFPAFPLEAFVADASDGLDCLAFKDRAKHLANALRKSLPADTGILSGIIVDSLGPKCAATKDLGLKTFFYFPHVFLIREALIGDFHNGMRANYAVTSRFTAEFSVRPFLMRYPEASLALLKEWARDPDPHVRRLASESTRPLLPWAERLSAFVSDPSPLFPLLEILKDDPDLYVRRSVANHLGDIAKHHPEKVLAFLSAWQNEIPLLDDVRKKQRKWMIRHALRLPLKKKNPEISKFLENGCL